MILFRARRGTSEQTKFAKGRSSEGIPTENVGPAPEAGTLRCRRCHPAAPLLPFTPTESPLPMANNSEKLGYGGYPTPSEARTYPKNNIALPTVGRIVLFQSQYNAPAVPAIVVAVDDGSHTIGHLHVFTTSGPKGYDMVRHVSDSPGKYTPRWDWMPYQKGQAAKTEQLQEELDKAHAAGLRPPIVEGRQHVSHRASDPASWDDGVSKTQAGAPSPEDGKR
jgi:hypothetical protein